MSPSFGLAGRTALVSGGTSGIGYAIARALAAAGADVLIQGSEPQPVIDRLAAGLSPSSRLSPSPAAGFSADLSAREGADRLAQWALAQRPAIDLLILCAAVQYRNDWTAIDDRQFDVQIDVNLRAPLRLLQRLVPPMAARGFGRVVTIGSVQQTKPHPEMLVYAATKAALRSMVRNLAAQVGPRGVTVNNIAPGAIATPRNAEWLDDPARRATVEAGIPLGRVGEAVDCAGLALLLCSPAGAYINGADLYVDGGLDVR